MPLVLKDRVRETSITTGTGTLTLNGAVTGFQSFSVIGNSNTTYYAIVDVTTGAWEVGVGTYTVSGTTLSRTTVLESSVGGGLVNFTANIKDVFCTYPAEQAVTLDDVQTLTNKTLTSPTLVTPALGTPNSGVVTNLTGTASININGTVGATTPAAGSFTTVTANGAITGTAGFFTSVSAIGAHGGSFGLNVGNTSGTNNYAIAQMTGKGSGGGQVSFYADATSVGGQYGDSTGVTQYIGLSTIKGKWSSTGLAVTGAVTASGATIGDGTLTKNITVSGGSSGVNGGASIVLGTTGITYAALGNFSALFGGAFDNTATVFGNGDIRLAPAGVTRATISSTGLAVTGEISATGSLSLNGSQMNVYPSGDFEMVHRSTGGWQFYTDNGSKTPFKIAQLAPTDTVNVTTTGLAVTGTVTSTTDATLSGVRVGKGAGAIASNTALGSSALNANTTGANNTASGGDALGSNTTGVNNTASGRDALLANTTGSNNTASGASALRNNTTGVQNTASGVSALQNNTTGGNNTASGFQALLNNTTGSENTAIGLNALLNNTTGSNNTATGRSALQGNTTGVDNTANGFWALLLNTTGSGNTASGQASLQSNTTGSNNTASGRSALRDNTTGASNTANGVNALVFNTSGFSNTANGQSALLNNTTGSGNTALNPLNSAGSYAPVFNPTTENNRFCMGSTGVTNAYIQVAWTVVSDARDKINFAPVPHGLEFVKALQPTAYQFRTARDSEETNGGVRYGFKAQDVLALEGANPVIVDNEDADKLRMIDTALIPVLVKALQELNAKFDAYVLTHP